MLTSLAQAVETLSKIRFGNVTVTLPIAAMYSIANFIFVNNERLWVIHSAVMIDGMIT